MNKADEALRITNESLEASKKSTLVAEQSLLIAHSSQVIVNRAKEVSRWNIGATAIIVVLAWSLGRYC